MESLSELFSGRKMNWIGRGRKRGWWWWALLLMLLAVVVAAVWPLTLGRRPGFACIYVQYWPWMHTHTFFFSFMLELICTCTVVLFHHHHHHHQKWGWNTSQPGYSLTNSLIETELGKIVRLRRGYRGKHEKKKAHTLARLCPVIIVPLLLALLLHNPSIHPSCLSALFLFAFSSPHFFPSHVFPVLLITDCQLAMAAAAKFNEFSGSEVCSLFCLFANWFGSGYVPAVAATTLNGRFWISGVISSSFLCVLVFFFFFLFPFSSIIQSSLLMAII